MSASTAVAPARRMALTEAKKLNGVVTTAVPGFDSGGGQGQPQRVGSRRTSQRVGNTQLRGGGTLEGRYLFAKNELLRRKHPAQGIQQLFLQGLVLALQVEHRHGPGCGCGSAWRNCGSCTQTV